MGMHAQGNNQRGSNGCTSATPGRLAAIRVPEGRGVDGAVLATFLPAAMVSFPASGPRALPAAPVRSVKLWWQLDKDLI